MNNPLSTARRRPLVWVATAFLLGVAGQRVLPVWGWWLLTVVALSSTAWLIRPRLGVPAKGSPEPELAEGERAGVPPSGGTSEPERQRQISRWGNLSAVRRWGTPEAGDGLSRIIAVGALLLAIVGLGALTAIADQRVPPEHVAWRVSEGATSAVVEGLVVSDPIWRAAAGHPAGQPRTLCFAKRNLRGQQMVLAVTAVDGAPAVGPVWLRHHQPAFPLRYGDRVLVHGTLRAPRPAVEAGAFDEAQWLWQQSLDGVVEAGRDDVEWVAPARGWRRVLRVIFDVKHHALGVLQQRVDALTAALLGALLAGDRADLPREVTAAFTDTGTVHLLSVSGWHVTLIGGLLWGAARLVFPRRGAAVATMVGLVWYGVFTGAQPPIVRSTLAGLVVLTGLCLRRPADPLNTLALAALLLIALAPRTLWAVAFQLSFASVLALLMLAPIGMAAARQLLERAFLSERGRRVVLAVFEPLVISIAVWLGTWPLVAYHLHRVTLIAWLANLFAVPLAALVMVTGLVVVFGGALHPWLVVPWVGAVQLASHALVAGLAWCARWPGATLACPPPPWWGLVGWYLGLAAAALEFKVLTQHLDG